MKQFKYLNAILTVIAICLTLITFAVTGLLPKANANPAPTKQQVILPVNPDGSLNVRVLNNIMDVNISEVGGYNTSGRIPVDIKEVGGYSTNGQLPVDIQEVGGRNTHGTLSVEIKK